MRGSKLMEVDVGGGKRLPTVNPALGLAVVGGGADIVDRYIVRRYETGEVEELVEVALHGQRHQHHRHLGFFLAILPAVEHRWWRG